MKRVMLTVAYDGTAYHGWQVQPGEETIESKLNEALSDLLGEAVRVSGASRTDSGVHALCNLAVFDTGSRMDASKFSYALNQRLPADIRVRRSQEVEQTFHPRYVPTIKTYEYKIWNDRFPNPLRMRDTYFCYSQLDTDRMREAAALLVGEHDFEGFSSSGKSVESTVRTITAAAVREELFKGGMAIAGSEPDEIVIRISGNGFLYNMVRIIAGTLIEVGRGAMEPGCISGILEKRDRALAGPTAPACGLVLTDYEFV